MTTLIFEGLGGDNDSGAEEITKLLRGKYESQLLFEICTSEGWGQLGRGNGVANHFVRSGCQAVGEADGEQWGRAGVGLSLSPRCLLKATNLLGGKIKIATNSLQD